MTALVLLHGFTGSPESFDEFAGYLPETFHLERPALFGHRGEPEAIPQQTLARAFEDEVDRLAAPLRNKGVEGAILLGYSLGARLGLGLLVRHPGLFSRAILVGVNPGLEQGERGERAERDAALGDMLSQQGLRAFLAEWENLSLFESQKSLPTELLDAQRFRREGHHPDGLAAALAALSLARMPDYRPHIADVANKLVLATGALDTRFERIARQLAFAHAKLQWKSFPGHGHNLVLEAPEALARLVVEVAESVAPKS
jgi:2-succinyl-6-hydroxy-2,4-cyclohexadiene-1-carboxylate synthase